jgi:hypothetical protein
MLAVARVKRFFFTRYGKWQYFILHMPHSVALVVAVGAYPRLGARPPPFMPAGSDQPIRAKDGCCVCSFSLFLVI